MDIGTLIRTGSVFGGQASIATSIRVLFHQTNNSISLVTHLSATNIKIASTRPNLPHGNPINSEDDIKKLGKVFFHGFGSFALGKNIAGYVPKLDINDIHEYLDITSWLKQIICVLDKQTILTRSKIILNAANKDGGAHVDSKLPGLYEKFKADGALGTINHWKQGVHNEQKILNAHYVSLRQMAFEVLTSKDLIDLLQ